MMPPTPRAPRHHPSPRPSRARSARRTAWVFPWLLLVVGVVLGTARAGAQVAVMPRELEHVGVDEHLDGPLPLDTEFTDVTGRRLRLGSLFDGKRPVVLTFAYHTCPVLCGMVLTNAVAGLKQVPWTLGKEYTAITISIDPRETLEKSAAKRTSVLAEYDRTHLPAVQPGWHFLTGDEASIAKVAAAAGFQYQYDERQEQWGHPSVVMVAKPDGRMARYLYGLEFPAADLRLALLEASEGRHISTVEKIILYCYHYDPQGGKYVLVARRVMQVGAMGVALVLFTVLGLFWARELRRARATKQRPAGDAGAEARASAA